MSKPRVALVTGGTGGIGTAICVALAEQGRKVVAGYYPPEQQVAEEWKQRQKSNGYDFEIIACDVSDFESSQQTLRDLKNTTGRIDILINCAGITRDKTLRKMSQEQWKAVLSTNLDSVFNVTRQVVEDMSANGFGRIVNISSVNGQKGQYGQANYSAAKAGLLGFTKAVAQELAASGVTVNSVSPGYVKTEMTDTIPTEIKDSILQQVPMGRMATPDEIAYVVSFLTDDRNTYMTGANLPVNGGMYMS